MQSPWQFTKDFTPFRVRVNVYSLILSISVRLTPKDVRTAFNDR